MLLVCIVLLTAVFALPKQSRELLQSFGKPLSQIIGLPLGLFASVDRGLKDLWDSYVSLYRIAEENRQLRQENQLLRGRYTELQERVAATQRLEGLLALKERTGYETVAARVIGRDASNWYQGVVLDKGESDGIKVEMGVMTPAGVVGRVVKTTPAASVVLLVTDPNNAVTGLIQRTRDEGIVEGTAQGRARMKYLPLLSTVQTGDSVVTSGLTGGFPRGLAIGTITSIQKAEGDLFQTAEIAPEVDVQKIEEVLVITAPRLQPGPEPRLEKAGKP